MPRILVLDDDKTMRAFLSNLVNNMGLDCDCAETLSEGLTKAKNNAYEVVFLDVVLPDGNGLEILPQIKETASSPEIIIITGYADSDGAELAIQHGAWDYIEKGAEIETIQLPLLRALQHHEEKQKQKTIPLDREGIIGNSPLIKQCLNQLAMAASSETDVLITGESGTGKELFAWAIHNNSRRIAGNFVTVDCASFPETLAESLLFGHEKGSFTGAEKRREGLIAQANGGTLFLDEIGELTPDLQKTFLRVLQERRFRPVGSAREIPCDFRLVSATNKNLEDMVQEGSFRNDLYYRLQTFIMRLPPLRERKEDIRDISIHHASKLSEQTGVELKSFSSEFFETLMAYHWPGNIRELKNAIEKAFFSSLDAPRLYPQHLPDRIRLALKKRSFDSPKNKDDTFRVGNHASEEIMNLSDYKNKMEEEYLRIVMERCQGDIPEACRISGVSRSGLYKLLHKYHLTKDDS